MPRPKPITAPHGPDALDRLRELAEADGRPQAEIAEAAGMRPSNLSAYLTGGRRNPSVGTIARILAALGRRWADLD